MPRGLEIDDDVPPDVADEARRVYEHLGLCCHVRLEMRCLGPGFYGMTRHPHFDVDCYEVWLAPVESLACDMMATVAHELRHVWQNETNRFQVSAVGPEQRWHPGPWRRYGTRYEEAAWELDAFQFERRWCRARRWRLRAHVGLVEVKGVMGALRFMAEHDNHRRPE